MDILKWIDKYSIDLRLIYQARKPLAESSIELFEVRDMYKKSSATYQKLDAIIEQKSKSNTTTLKRQYVKVWRFLFISFIYICLIINR